MSQHHDPVHPDSDHLTPELVADLDEGLLDPTSTEHARQHLEQCPACRRLRDALASTKAHLSALPAVQMPDDVSERLFAAIGATKAAPTGATTVVPISAASSRRAGWAGRGLGIAASVAGILLIGALVVPSLMDTSANDSGSAATGTDDSAGAPEARDKVDFAASKTGTKYQAAKLSQQVDSLVTEASAGQVDSGTVSAQPTETATTDTKRDSSYQQALAAAVATNPAAAQACLEQYLNAEGVQPLAIDIGTFYDADLRQFQPAAVIVLPIDGQPVKADVYVVDPECSGPDARLLYWARIDLPN